jgi:hypothetical protein
MANKLGKLAKVNESITINRYDNGWMVEVGGRDTESDWNNCKIVFRFYYLKVKIVNFDVFSYQSILKFIFGDVD